MKTQLWPSTDKSALLRSQFAKLLYGINRIVRLFDGNKNTTILKLLVPNFILAIKNTGKSQVFCSLPIY